MSYIVFSFHSSTVIAQINGDLEADFYGSPIFGAVPLTVTFVDMSTPSDDIDSWFWKFGDGETSTEKNPIHTYQSEGRYTVELTVDENGGDDDDDENNSDNIRKRNYILVYANPNDDPVADAGGPYSGVEGISISFDGSGSYDSDGTITSYHWDFGDGGTSSNIRPNHVYLEQGFYSVILSVTDNDSGEDTDTTSVSVIDSSPIASFTANTTIGYAPLNVSFSDSSISYDGIVSWLWDFGDESFSTERNPIHTFNEGNFSVSLTVKEEDGDSNTQITFIAVDRKPNSIPIADFEIQSSSKPAIGEEIAFIDQSFDSDGSIVTWQWIFGDGVGSTTKNPIHQYMSLGSYIITLVVEDNEGATNSTYREITIYDVEPPATSNDYDDLWHNSDYLINLNAIDNHSGIKETYYKINNGPVQQLSANGQPLIQTEGTNSTLEYWSIDEAGNEETHHRLFNIKLDKTSPNAQAGNDITINEDTVVNFNSLNSRDNIKITEYSWVISDTITQRLDGPNPQYIFNTPGIYLANLTVFDVALNSASDTIAITVLDNTDPNARAGDDQTVYEDTTVTFDGSASTDNVEIVNYSWNFIDDEHQSLDGVNPSYFFESAGIYEVILTVSDAQGNTATDTVAISVVDATWPIANSGPDQIVEEDSYVIFDGSLSHDNVGIVSYVWTFTDDTIQTLQGVNASYLFENPGNYVVTLTVSDAEMHSSNDTLSIIVRDVTAPTIDVEDYATVVEDSPIIFNASNSYDNQGITNFNWKFGDGTSENTTTPFSTHIYTQPGVYDVELLVTDLTGNTNTARISIVVHRDTDGDLIADHLDTDDDGDGLPDEWEILHGLNPLDDSDAILDQDGDGISNIEEYKEETNPTIYDFSTNMLSIILVIAIFTALISYGVIYSRKFKR